MTLNPHNLLIGIWIIELNKCDMYHSWNTQIILFIFYLNDWVAPKVLFKGHIGSWCLHAIISKQSVVTNQQ